MRFAFFLFYVQAESWLSRSVCTNFCEVFSWTFLDHKHYCRFSTYLCYFWNILDQQLKIPIKKIKHYETFKRFVSFFGDFSDFDVRYFKKNKFWKPQKNFINSKYAWKKFKKVWSAKIIVSIYAIRVFPLLCSSRIVVI